MTFQKGLFWEEFKYPLILGLLVGGLVSLDSFIPDYFYRMHLGLPYSEYFTSFSLFLFVIGTIILIMNLAGLWQKRAEIFIISLIASSQMKGLTSVGFLDLSDLVVITFLIVWLTKTFDDIDYDVVVTPLSLFILLLILSMLLSYTGEIGASRGSPYLLLGPAKWLVTVFLILNFARMQEHCLLMIKAFVVVTLVSGIIGIIESLYFYTFLGIDFHPGELYHFETTPFGTFLRPQAFLGHIHGLAACLAMSSTLLFYLLLYPRIYGFWKRRTVALIFGASLFALVITLYKGAWLAFGLVAIIALFFRKPSFSIHIILGVLITVILIFATGVKKNIATHVSYRLYTGDFKARLDLDKAGVEGFLHQHPFIGTGYGNNRVYTSHPAIYPAHNAFIQVADELGVFGLVSYCMIFLYLFYRLISTYFLLRRREEKIIIQALLLSFVAFFIIAQFEPLAYNFWFWVYFGLMESTSYVFLRPQQRVL